MHDPEAGGGLNILGGVYIESGLLSLPGYGLREGQDKSAV